VTAGSLDGPRGSLDGRVAIVTGGSRHLGRAYALGLAREGAAVVVADMADAGPVAGEVEDEGGRSMAIAVDVTDPAATEAMAERTVERFGQIDVLVNNAGYFKQARKGPWHEIDPEEWDRAFDVNVRGTWLCCRSVVPHMKRRGSGRIINIGSNTVYKGGPPGFLHYISSKSAIIGLTRSLARELGEFNVAVNALCPDYIPDAEQKVLDAANHEFVISQRVFKRPEVPEDMIGALTFLAGPGSDFITGQSILVNGGIVLQ
jgi:NAD(P)-dependent dehydrogenase (short-subunit alcohol dehydrogenase family)